MSLKENVNYIKEEVSAQESFIENFFKVEKFYKKNKMIILGTVAVVILALVGNSVNNYLNEQHKIEANNIFNKVLANPDDKTSLEQLKAKDKKLYELALFTQDNKKATTIEFLKEISVYSKAIEEKNTNAITTISQNQKFLLKDFAILNRALIETQNGKYKEAKETLALISETSSVANLAKVLNHFLLTK